MAREHAEAAALAALHSHAVALEEEKGNIYRYATTEVETSAVVSVSVYATNPFSGLKSSLAHFFSDCSCTHGLYKANETLSKVTLLSQKGKLRTFQFSYSSPKKE